MDANDAQYYNDAIDKINDDDKAMLRLIKEQSIVVQSTIKNFNSTINSVRKHETTLYKNLLIFANVTNQLQQQVTLVDIRNTVFEHFSLLSTILLDLDLEYEKLIDAVLYVNSNLLHPSIMTPAQLLTELQSTIPHLPEATRYPLELRSENMASLLKLAELQMYHMNSRLICVVSIPIIEQQNFYLYHLLPLPTLVNDVYRFINPTAPYFAISDSKLRYTYIDLISDCRTLTPSQYICQLTHPVTLAHLHPSCETESLLLPKQIPDTCELRELKSFTTTLWQKLINKNRWLYVNPNSDAITINCQNDAPVDVHLSKTGIFSLDS